MARSIWVSPRALQDVADLAVYLGRTNATAASNFLDAFDRLCDVISQSPEIGSPVRFANSRLDGLRVLRLRRFRITLSSICQVVKAFRLYGCFTDRATSTPSSSDERWA
jgi:plasmid stabilization system protein ParE